MLRINSGSNVPVVDALGRTWSADGNFSILTNTRLTSTVMASSPIFGGSELFQSERNSPSRTELVPFYAFSLAAGNYTLRLYFADNNKVRPRQRMFGLDVNGITLGPLIDIVGRVAPNNVLTIEVTNVIVTPLADDMGILSISLLRHIGNPKINALEVYNVSFGEYATNATNPISWVAVAHPETVRKTPVENLKVTCGDSNNVPVTHGDVWVAETNYLSPGALATNTRSYGWLVESTGLVLDVPLPLYPVMVTERYATINNPEFYVFDVPNGVYNLSLYFMEFSTISAGKRVFDIVVNNQTLDMSVDIAARTNSVPGRVLILYFSSVVVTTSQIRISLFGIVGNPKINALEFHRTSSVIPPSSALPLSLRVRCGYSGAPLVDGVGRTWVPDRYHTAWTAGHYQDLPFGISNISSDLTPLFNNHLSPVPDYTGLLNPTIYNIAAPNGQYDMTLYFAETSSVTVGQRVFDVIVQDTVVYGGFDVAELAGIYTAYSLPVRNIVVSDGVLQIGLQYRVGIPFINAFAIIPSPSAPLPSLPVPVRIDCGASIPYTDKFSRVWSEDKYFDGVNTRARIVSDVTVADAVADASILYHTERIQVSPISGPQV